MKSIFSVKKIENWAAKSTTNRQISQKPTKQQNLAANPGDLNQTMQKHRLLRHIYSKRYQKTKRKHRVLKNHSSRVKKSAKKTFSKNHSKNRLYTDIARFLRLARLWFLFFPKNKASPTYYTVHILFKSSKPRLSLKDT